ncbi:MAG: ComEC/Rec2 family competence protein [Helicobacteraceae bacterium]|nr:ComEC/Rec2 family competence protein [Helicobacteraceae bacterium]
MFLEYKNFRVLTERKFFDIEAVVVGQTQKTSKRGASYWVLRLSSGNYGTFYTSTYEDIVSIVNKKVRLVVITDNITFINFLRGFYAPSFNIALLPAHKSGERLYDKAVTYLADQHEDGYMRELFPAMFLAAPQSAQLRLSVTKYAAAHMIALSGFHLAILSLLLGVVVGLPYRVLQARFFPYRNGFIDLGAISLVLLGFYLVFTGVVPSLLRAYVMFAFGFFLVMRHLELISFQTLLVVAAAIVALDPPIISNIGFLLSVSGVFYIYLFLRYFGHIPKIAAAVMICIYVFFAMLPIVHFFFPISAHSQLLSPLLTLLYSPFFIVELLLHLLRVGDLFDPFLIAAINLEVPVWLVSPPLWLMLSYAALSIAAIFHRAIHYALILFIAGWGVYQYVVAYY